MAAEAELDLSTARSRDDVVVAVYESHYSDLVGLARLLVDDRGEAEEVVQEAMVRLFSRFRTIRDPERALSYVRSIVLNEARGRLRKRRSARRYIDRTARQARIDGPGPDLTAIDRETVVRAVQALPPKQAECVVLRFYSGLAIDEIAEAMSISAGSVKTHLSRARAHLADELEELR